MNWLSRVRLLSSTQPFGVALALLAAGLNSAGAVPAATAGWKVQRSPTAGGSFKSNNLSGVAATSVTNAWAVGSSSDEPGFVANTLIDHRNGRG